ncbi:MAG: hypothetical protein Tsb009_36300 [Planctomycetaceae bacterium]
MYLKDGAKISGANRGFTETGLLWEKTDGKTIEVPLEKIDRIEYPLPVNGPKFESAGGKVVDDPLVNPSRREKKSLPKKVVEPTRNTLENLFHATAEGFSSWTKRLELGARFLDGNSDEDFITAGGKFERIHKNSVGQLDFSGQYGRSDGDVTANRWNGNFTYDYGRKGNWIVFATLKNEYDEFENLDYRGTYSSGIGYRFYNEEDRRLIVRVGPGVTYELFRDPDHTRTTPDGFAELEINWPLGSRSSYEAKTTVNPSLNDISVVRLISNNGVLIKLDTDGRWKLKLGFRYEYNSDPNENRLPSDFTSSVRIVYTRK